MNYYLLTARQFLVGILLLIATAGSAYADTFVVTKTADTNDGFCDVDCSLREAIAAANATSFASIEFSAVFSNPQTIVLSGTQLDLVSPLTINGPGAHLLTVSANQMNRVFDIYSPADFTINNLTIADGRFSGPGGAILAHGGAGVVLNDVVVANSSAEGGFGEGGGIYSCGGQISISGSTFRNNSAGSMGGGAIASNDNCVSGRPHSLTISNSFFNNNSTTNNGGGINSSSPTTISDTVLSGNSANIGGAISISLASGFGSFNNVSFLDNEATTFAGGLNVSRFDTIADCIFIGNTAGTNGGALLIGDNDQEKTILRTSFSMNSAQDGGAFYASRGRVTLSSLTVDHNHATRNGGAIYLESAPVHILNSQITNNLADQSGGGIYKSGDTLNLNSVLIDGNTSNSTSSNGGGGGFYGSGITLTNTTIIGNTAAGQGGALFLTSSVLLSTIYTSLIANNVANQNGGAVYKTSSNLNINDSTFAGNSATGSGGALHNFYSALGGTGTVGVVNSTFSGNVSANSGGAIFNRARGVAGFPVTNSRISVSHTTFSDNSASVGAGGIHNFSDTNGLAYSEITGSVFKTGTGTGANINLTTISFGYNLSSDDGGGFFTNVGDLTNTNPLLGPLQNNGGLTPTHGLLPGSPAIDSGNPNFVPPPDYDQRGPGFSRVFTGRIDKGSFEVQPFTTPTPTPTLTPTPTPSPTPSPSPSSSPSAEFDYDGDTRTDFSVFRPSTGAWYLQRSTAGFQGLQFGAEGDKLTPADYDGDGKTDIAVYRPSAGQWFVLKSSTGTVDYPVFGASEDLPAPGDFDGDGRADLVVFRPSQGIWYRVNSSNGSFFAFPFGQAGDVPTVGDFDGDGKNDYGIFRPSIGDWYHVFSGNGGLFGERFGQSGDRIAPADYDGDGKTDIAIFRPSTGLWVVRNSATATYSYYVFGSPSDVPISGDYDGDGKADIGVWRPSDGTWYIKRSDNGQFIVFPWGQNGDTPTPAAYGN